MQLLVHCILRASFGLGVHKTKAFGASDHMDHPLGSVMNGAGRHDTLVLVLVC